MPNEKAALYARVEALRLTWRVGGCPVDPFEICAALPGLELEFAPLRTRGLRGALLLPENEPGTPPEAEPRGIILLNSRRSKTEHTFDCAHELMHWALHGRGTEGRGAGILKKEFLEWQANEGAAELLLPHRLLLTRIAACRFALSSASNIRRLIMGLCDDFGVGEAVVRLRLESLKFEIDCCRRGIHPERVPVYSRAAWRRAGFLAWSLNDWEEAYSADNAIRREMAFSGGF